MYRRIFKFHRWESIKLFIYGLGNLDYTHETIDLILFIYAIIEHYGGKTMLQVL